MSTTMGRQQGQVLAVTTRLQGSFALADSTAGAVQLADSADFARDGGVLRLDTTGLTATADNPTTPDPDAAPLLVTYVGVVESLTDDVPDQLVLAADAPAIPADALLLVYPDAVEVDAEVSLPGDPDTVVASVPHALRPLVLDGVRDDDNAEWVELDHVGHSWVVADVVGRAPAFTAQTILDLSDKLDADQTARDEQLAALNQSLATEAQTRSDALVQAGKDLAAERQARSAADTSLSTAITTRPMVTSSASAPATPNTGDTWFKLDSSGNTVGVQTWNGTAWVPQALTGAALLAGSITTANLAAGAITGDKISAGTVTADKLLVGSTENLIRDGELLDPVLAHNWTSVAANCSRVVDAAHGPVLRFTTGTAGAFATANQTFAVVLGDEIAYQFRAWQTGTHQSGNRVGVAIYATKADGSTSYGLGTMVDTPTGGMSTGVLKVTDPTWRTVQFRAYCSVTTAGTETFDLGQMVARRRSAGTLLVDGTVTATQLAAGAVTADKVAAGAVTTDKLAAGAVTASTIAAGAIGTDKLAANAITSDKLSANAVTAASIAAGAIDGMTVSGADIYSPNATATPRVHLGGSVLEVVRSDGENTYVSASLGGASADQLQLMAPSGQVLAGFDSTGAGTAQSLAVNGDAQVAGNVDAASVSLNGSDLQTTLNTYPTGEIARQLLGGSAAGNGVKFGSTWLGYYELFYTSPGHFCRVTYDGLIQVSAAGTYVFRLISTANPDPTVVPTSPKADASTGNVLAQANIIATGAGYYSLHITGRTGPYSGSQRVLLAAQAQTSGTWGQVYSADNAQAWFVAEDTGAYAGMNDGGYNRGGGTVYSGSSTPTETAPVATKRTYTSIWNAAWVKSWRDGSAVTDYLQQGNYGGAQRYSMVGFTGANAVVGETSKSITAALAGATVSKVELYMVNHSFYSSSGGEAIIGHHGNNTAPASAQTSGGGAFATDTWASGAGQWVTLPSSWYPYIASGNYDGVTLGEGAGTSLTYYGKFSNALKDNRLRITYTR